MITIKRDRGRENPATWDEVEALPGYVKDVDPSTAELDAVIGKYREPELRVCGLSSCHTKHFRGYLVTTKDGRLTNIGVDCGSTHFGVDFDTLSRQLDRDWKNQERREAITSARALARANTKAYNAIAAAYNEIAMVRPIDEWRAPGLGLRGELAALLDQVEELLASSD